MKSILTISAVCAISAAALADSNLHPVTGVRQASYEMAAGRLTPMNGERGTVDEIWAMENNTDTYFGAMDFTDGVPDLGSMSIDWGDLGDPNRPATLGGYQFAYAVPTTLTAPSVIDATIFFWGQYDGFNNNGFYALAGFYTPNLPTTVGTDNGWLITIDIQDPNDFSFDIAGNDIDGDGRVDFGYSYWFPSSSGSDLAIGPFICNPDLATYGTVAAAEAALGHSEGWDAWVPDPNDPNVFLYSLGGTFWFGGYDPNDPNTDYSQFYMVLYRAIWGCGTPGASGMFCYADIDGTGDCAVGLADLALLLGDYNTPPPVISPADFDGNLDVDLSDLATLLAQYGDDCTH